MKVNRSNNRSIFFMAESTSHISLKEVERIVLESNELLLFRIDELTKMVSRIINDKTYSVKEVSDITGKSERMIRHYIFTKKLQAFNNGKGTSYFINQEQLNSFLNLLYENK